MLTEVVKEKHEPFVQTLRYLKHLAWAPYLLQVLTTCYLQVYVRATNLI